MSPPPPPQFDKRQQIVGAAYSLFKHEGYHAVGIDRIIAEAGVAKRTMYRHFPSKDALIVEVLRHRAKRFEAQLDRLTLGAEAPAETLARIIGWYERWFAREDFNGCAFAHALAEFGEAQHPVFQAVLEQKDAFRRRLCTVLGADPGDAAANRAAASLFMLFEGSTLLAHMGHAGQAVQGLRDAASAILAGAGKPS